MVEYLNSDLDLVSREDPAELVEALRARGVIALSVTEHRRRWYATFEARGSHGDGPRRSPERHAAAILRAVEALPRRLRAVWNRCALREINLGFDCGDRPWAFDQGLSAALLGRMARAGTALRLTLYPADRGPERGAAPNASQAESAKRRATPARERATSQRKRATK